MELKFLQIGQNLNSFRKELHVREALYSWQEQSFDVWDHVQKFNYESLHKVRLCITYIAFSHARQKYGFHHVRADVLFNLSTVKFGSESDVTVVVVRVNYFGEFLDSHNNDV
jgi:hypothetical protein